MRKLAVPLLLLPLLTAFAADHMKAGLWEMTIKSDAMKNMPKISPQQREQMHRMGISVPQMDNDGMVTKVCVSQQMAERDQPPVMSHDASGCKTRNFQRNGGGYSLEVVCDGMMKGEGKAKGTFSGSDSFTSSYDFNGTVQGRPVSQHQETSGKWLSADCGDVKPLDQLLPKK